MAFKLLSADWETLASQRNLCSQNLETKPHHSPFTAAAIQGNPAGRLLGRVSADAQLAPARARQPRNPPAVAEGRLRKNVCVGLRNVQSVDLSRSRLSPPAGSQLLLPYSQESLEQTPRSRLG